MVGKSKTYTEVNHKTLAHANYNKGDPENDNVLSIVISSTAGMMPLTCNDLVGDIAAEEHEEVNFF
jgi:hypothetical protein